MSCGPYVTSYCHQLAGGEKITVTVTTECRPGEQPPCTECQENHAQAVARAQEALPPNC